MMFYLKIKADDINNLAVLNFTVLVSLSTCQIYTKFMVQGPTVFKLQQNRKIQYFTLKIKVKDIQNLAEMIRPNVPKCRFAKNVSKFDRF